MDERVSVREDYDVVVGIAGKPPRHPCVAYALIKLAYRIDVGRGALERAEAVPLENDIRDDDLDPRLPAHSDFWLEKEWTDVALIGSAFAPEGRPIERMTAGVEIGTRKKEVAVFGDREVEWTRAGMPKASSPESFTEMPLTIDRAYGGCDFRVPYDTNDPRADSVTLKADYPGLYPRNPWGTGYLAVPDPIEGIRLPNLEDPGDPLTDDRLVVADPALWYQQPLPWHLDWLPINCFPRNVFLAIECEPWFEAPDDARLPEVQRGILPEQYRNELQAHTFGTEPHWRFRQEASHGLTFSNEPMGAPVRLTGTHLEHPTLSFDLPELPPEVEMTVEHKTEGLRPRLASVAFYPDAERVTLTYTVRMEAPRPFIPGIHKNIPIAVSIDGDRVVEYTPPPTLHERLRAAAQEKDEQ